MKPRYPTPPHSGLKMASQISTVTTPAPTADRALTAALPWSLGSHPAIVHPSPSVTLTLTEWVPSTSPASLSAETVRVARKSKGLCVDVQRFCPS